jgi:hypothetical protein
MSKHKDEGYVDLDKDVVKDTTGRRIREADAEQLAQEAHERIAKRGRGRPSLSGKSAESPQIAFRVSADVRKELTRRARREHKKVSDVVRDAIDAYL